ncbi:hypothetical protein F0365_04745 [Nonlabens sp. Ci31]|jgi:hypothetical protein|uniref:hypothetical protein n=1 Tax=Nonlabens sp. Ci31 TaxID=2608253 RepID=UPI00146427D9|nr:hypothetical protein [Nonlabens sp. Ci31]QJP33761.1 hypothetical protein F0365_04745 [Nonlabens sp. Ci31]
MKKYQGLLIASILNAVFFVWVYIVQIYEIKWTIVGVFYELLIIPMMLLAPTLLVLSVIQIKKKGLQVPSFISLLLSAGITVSLLSLFIMD